VERFGAARDEWIKEDLDSWLAPNRIYDGVADALRSLKGREDVYIVTTKQVFSQKQQILLLKYELFRDKIGNLLFFATEVQSPKG